MNPAQTAFLEALRPVLGPKGIITDPALIAPWEIDWRRRFSGHAPAIVAPADTGQVQAVLRAAAEHRVPLVPQGGNSSMVGGATPPADGSALILSMRRMNRIRRIDAGAGMVVAEAGVWL
ncbi:FAD-binding oxidoreductase, partial [Sphingomonas sanguinis]